MIPHIRLALFIIMPVFILYTDTVPAGGDCAADGGLGYICGLDNPEDALQLGDSRWLIVSGLQGWEEASDTGGHLYLVNHRDKSFELLFPGSDASFEQDRDLFPDCPGPINPENFSAHGLSLQKKSKRQYRLYMTSHGEREAIEVFDIDTGGDKPAITWTGCVLLPEKMWGNSVAILPDGGFVATKSKDSTDPEAFANLVKGRITGAVYEWHPGGEVTEIPGTALSCPNGIVVSPDGHRLYVAVMGSREVVRFNRSVDAVGTESVELSVYPDNIRWGDDGMLYTIGRNYVPGGDCPWLNCGTGWSVIRIDPETLAAERVAGADETVAIQAPSSVITVGNEFWIGNFDGDRVGYLPRD